MNKLDNTNFKVSLCEAGLSIQVDKVFFCIYRLADFYNCGKNISIDCCHSKLKTDDGRGGRHLPAGNSDFTVNISDFLLILSDVLSKVSLKATIPRAKKVDPQRDFLRCPSETFYRYPYYGSGLCDS